MSNNLNLSIDINALDNASGVFRTVGSVMQNLASGNIMGAVVTAGKAVAGALTDCVKSASELQQATSQTAQVIKSTGDASGMSAQQIADLADNLSKVTPFSRDVTQSGENLLLTFTNIGQDVFPQATQAMLDISQAMGQSVSSSAVQLGKALNDPLKGFSALQRIGVTFSDSEKEQIKTMMAHNDIIGAQKVMLGELSKEFGGSATAAGQTFAGQMQILQNRLEDVKASIGTALLPALSQVVGVFTALTSGQALGGLGPVMQQVSGFLGIMASNWQNLADDSKPFIADLRQFGALLGQLLPMIAGQAMDALNMLQLAFISLARGAEIIAGPALQILQQIIKGILVATYPITQAIDDSFIPALNNLVEHVAPVIAAILSWVANSGAIPAIFSLIGNAVGIVITVFSNLINIGLSVVDFFANNQTAMNALLAVLGTVAVLIVASLIPALMAIGATIFTTMIPAFAAWAIGAISAGISTLIAFWPIILAAALVAAAIFIVIEIIQHWGQIGAWLQTAWKAVANFFVGLWNGIVAGLKAAWNAIVNVVKIAGALLLAVVLGPFIAIGALFIWLYQHNTYFKNLVDAIVNFIKGCVAWLQDAWKTVIEWIVVQWNALVVRATAIWNLVSKTIHDGFAAAIGFVQSVWNTISGVFSSAWNTYVAGPLTTLWNNVSSVFANAWNTYIATPLTNIWNQVSKWFTDLGTNAMNSGKNFISMLVNGIASGAGAIWNAVVNIANTIWRALGFHSPAKEGPGAEADTWMPNLVNMLSSDLMKGIPKIQAAVNAVAQPLATLGSPQAATAATGPATTSQSSGDNNNIAIHVHLDGSGTGPDAQRRGKDIADVVKKELARHLRQQSIAPRYTSGGTHN